MNDPVLYVEDGPDDVFFMQRAFKKVAPEVELHVISDGQEAANFFAEGKGDDRLASLSLVILDLNLPGLSGLEVLERIRARSKFRHVPVIIFSASAQQSDIDSCYAGGCNAYLVKPHSPDDLRSLVVLINQFWLQANQYSKAPGGVAIVSDSTGLAP